MPQYYTLEEAARVLGLSTDDLKLLVQQNRLQAFRDGSSWRFRVSDIDEEARRRGMGSDPELPLSDLDLETPLDTGSDDQIDLTEYQAGFSPPDFGPSAPQPTPFSTGTDDDILLDQGTLPLAGPGSGSSSTIIGMQPDRGKKPSDSDVKLVPEVTKGASDSDVRLGFPAKKGSDSDVTLGLDTGSSEDLLDVASAAEPEVATEPHVIPLPFDQEKRAPSESDSDFDLTPSSVMDALEPESGSDFELTALDASDELDTIIPRGPSDSDVTGAEPSTSGVNLGRPSDSGINLQAVGGFEVEAADSMELAPIDEGAPPAGQSGKTTPLKRGEHPSKGTDRLDRPEKPDLSATALPIRSDKDIFEDTDFDVDVDAIDSSSDEDRTVQLDAQSDFDVEDSSGGDSASEVFAVDEEDVDVSAATALGPGVAADEDEDEGGFEADSDDVTSAWEEEVTSTPSSAAVSRPSMPALSQAGAAPEWGGLWVGLLGLATFLVLLGGFVSIDLFRNLHFFQGNSPASGLIKSIAGLLGG